MTRPPEEAASPRVLVVDDEADLRDMIQMALELEDITVDTAANGLEALKRLKEKRYTMILLDLMMPEMDGRQFREAQKKDPAIAGVPVVLMTGDRNTERKAAEIGASSFLKKPIESDDLIEAVRNFCR